MRMKARTGGSPRASQLLQCLRYDGILVSMTSSRRQEPPKGRTATRTLAKGAAVGAVGKAGASGSHKAVAASAVGRPAKAGKIVTDTRTASAHKPRVRARQAVWLLQDAKARFSELVRRVKVEGPQQVSVHGKVEVVVMSADEYRRLKGERTGAALIEALQASPSRDVELTPMRAPMPVRTVEL
jgi:prevent-host-death family protein